MSNTITLNREDLAKFMALCQQTILSIVSGKDLSKEALKKTYEVHMEPGFIEGAMAGIGQDFDSYQTHGQDLAGNSDLIQALQEIAEEMGEEDDE